MKSLKVVNRKRFRVPTTESGIMISKSEIKDLNERKSMIPDYEIISEQDIRREKEKARHMRQSGWWMRKIQKGICHYCRREVGMAHLTMDHVVPLSRGGKSRKGNIVPACKECNNKKKSLLPIEWEEYTRALQERPPSL